LALKYWFLKQREVLHLRPKPEYSKTFDPNPVVSTWAPPVTDGGDGPGMVDTCRYYQQGALQVPHAMPYAQVKCEMAVQHGKIIDIDSDESEEKEDNGLESITDVISMCKSMEHLCLRHGKPETSL